MLGLRVGDPGGHEDQYAAAYGGFLRLSFRKDGRVEVRRVNPPGERLRKLEERLLLFYMGTARSAASLQETQRRGIARHVPVLKEMRDMVDRAEEIAIDRAKELGAHGYVIKPFNCTEFLTLLAKVLEQTPERPDYAKR